MTGQSRRPTTRAEESVDAILRELEDSLGYHGSPAQVSCDDRDGLAEDIELETPVAAGRKEERLPASPWDGASLLDYEYLLRHQAEGVELAGKQGRTNPQRGRQRPVLPSPWPLEIETGAGRIAAALIAERKRARRNLFLFVGPSGEEGVSTLTQASAEKLARGGQRVLLLDADLRKAAPGKRYGVENYRGLADLQHGRCGFEDAVSGTPVPNLWYLPPGVLRLGEEISDRGIDDLCRELAGRFDFVLIDCPPVLASPVLPVFASTGARVVLVARAHRTRRHVLAKALDELGRLKMAISVIVLNERDFPLPDWLYRLL